MKLDTVQHVYTQASDACATSAHGDFLFLSAETCDGGGGNYLVFSTERWSIDAESLEEFVAALRGMLDAVEPVKSGDAA